MEGHCEYGCKGGCRDLDHWRDRCSYFKQVADNQLERAEAAEAERDEARAELRELRNEAQVSGDNIATLDGIAQAEANRADRYREALERVAETQPWGRADLRAIAQAALNKDE